MPARPVVRLAGIATLLATFAGVPRLSAQPTSPAPATRDTAVFSGGCFWGVQAVFARVRGVLNATSGYAGGALAHPNYEQVSTGDTGHAESVRVIYDPAKVSYDQLLDVFFTVAHDPTELNRQGPDEGTQYRSAIFYHTPAQERGAHAFVAKLTQEKRFSRPIVTQIAGLAAFYPAEAYHQNYFDLHPDQAYIVYNDKPKVEALKKKFAALYNGK